MTDNAVLHGDPLQRVFYFLDSRALCVVCQVSRGWAAAGCQDQLWHNLAAQKWPSKTLRLHPFYSTYRELVKDDNKRSACPTIDLASMHKHSAYKYNRPNYFLQCRLTMLQWDRHAQLVRLYFDARGDLESRQADSSFAAVVMDRPEHNYHPCGGKQPRMSDLIQTSRSEDCNLWICTSRHHKGCLVWHEQELFESPYEFSVSAYKPCDASRYGKPHKFLWNKALVFCYANVVVSGPQHLDADCTCVELLKIPANSHYKDAFLAQCTSFELPGATAETLKNQNEQQSRLLWHSLPDVIHSNPNWWG